MLRVKQYKSAYLSSLVFVEDGKSPVESLKS